MELAMVADPKFIFTIFFLTLGPVKTHIPHPQLAHTRSEGAKVNHPRQSVSKNTQ